MRILFLLPDLPLSGTAIRTVQVVERLVAKGHQAAVMTLWPRADPRLAARLRSANAKANPWRALMRADVIHAALPAAGVVAVCLAALFRRPLVYSYTNCLQSHRPFARRSPANVLRTAAERLLAARSDRLHAVSASVAAQVRAAFPRAASRTRATIEPALPPRPFRVDAPPQQPRLLCAGRLVPHKRCEDVLRAAAFLREEWPLLELVILGDGPECERLRAMARELGLADNVHFAGAWPEAGAFFAWANLLVHPSLYEGFARVLAEAEAARVPVVTIDAPYGREYARRRGAEVFLARPLDPASLASAIAQALLSSARAS
jgi:glycosyltransferase involved in cell wall biosynthesis